MRHRTLKRDPRPTGCSADVVTTGVDRIAQGARVRREEGQGPCAEELQHH